MEALHVELSQFEPSKMMSPRTNSLCFGKRGSGKTTLLLNILYHISKFYSIGCAIVPTPAVRDELRKHMPSSLIWPELDIDKLQLIMSKFNQSKTPEWLGLEMPVSQDIPNWLVILDDCGYNESKFRDKVFTEIYMNGRHSGQGTFLNLQRIKSIPPALRGQLDYLFCFRDVSKVVQETIHKEYFSFLSFPIFKDLYMKCTDGYGCIVLDVQKAQRLQDLSRNPASLAQCVFGYTAQPIHTLPAFNMFDKYVWKFDIALKRLCIAKRSGAKTTTTTTTVTTTTPAIVIGTPSTALPAAIPTTPSPHTLSALPKPLSVREPIASVRYSGVAPTTFSSLQRIPTSQLRPSKRQKTCRKGGACESRSIGRVS